LGGSGGERITFMGLGNRGFDEGEGDLWLGLRLGRKEMEREAKRNETRPSIRERSDLLSFSEIRAEEREKGGRASQ